jgi:hypothetical protein
VAAAESVYGGLQECASGGRERKRKDNAEALSSRRFAEEEGCTTEDMESTEKKESKTVEGGGEVDSRDGISIVEFGVGAGG